MSGPFVVVVAVVLAALGLLVARVVAGARARRSGSVSGPVTVRRGALLNARLAVGPVLGFAAAALLWWASAPLHSWVLATPMVAATGVLAGVAATGVGGRRPVGPSIRRAALVPRTVRSVVGRVTPAVLRFAVLVTVVGLIGTGLAGDPDGRSLTTVSGGPTGLGMTVTTSPWPGWFYAVPALVGLGICWAAFEIALAAIVHRPADPHGVARWDRARLAAVAGLLGVVPVLGAVLASAGSQLGNRADGANPAWLVLAVGGVVIVVVSAAGWLVALLNVVLAVVQRPDTSAARGAVQP